MLQTRLAFNYLSGRKLRTVMTTLSIVLGVMIIFGLNGMLPAIVSAFRQSMLAGAGQVDLSIVPAVGSGFDQSALGTVRDTPGVAAAAGTLVRPVAVPPGTFASGQTVSSLRLNGVDLAGLSGVRELAIEDGRTWQPGEKGILVSSELAQIAGLQLGQKIVLPSASGSAEFALVGTIASPPGEAAQDIYMPLEEAQALLGHPGQITGIDVIFQSTADPQAVRADLAGRLGSAYKVGEPQTTSEMLASMQIAEVAFNFIGFMALVMGGFIIFNTFRTIVVERRHDIGMLRALGASRRTIQGLFLTESLLQGVIGTALGLLAGYGLVALALVAFKPTFESMLRISIGGPQFSPITLVTAVALGLLVPLAAGYLPARAAARITPLDALRPMPAETGRAEIGRRVFIALALLVMSLVGLVSGSIAYASLGIVLFLAALIMAGPLLVMPIARTFSKLLALIYAREGRLAENNLVRQPSRSAITITTVMIGLAILLALVGMGTNLISGVLGYIDRSLGSDYLFMPQSVLLNQGNIGAGPELVAAVRAAPGIENATSLRASHATAGGLDVQVVGIDPVSYPKISGLMFSAGEPDEAFAALSAGRSLIANGIFANQLGLKAGDTLTLQTLAGPRDYKIAAIAHDYLNVKVATVYASQDNLAADFNETGDLLLLASQAPGTDEAATRAALQSISQDYPAFNLYFSGEWKQAQIDTVFSKLSVMYILLAFLAVPSLIGLANTLGTNVLERTREIGMLRAVGATRRQIRRMIVAESLLLSLAGIGFGILAGLWLGYILVGAMNVSGFVVQYSFPATGVLLTIAVGLIFGVLAALLPARQAANMDIVRALQYE